MTNDPGRDFIRDCQGMSHEQITAAYHADYYDDAKAHVLKAFEEMGIEEHEVAAWVRHVGGQCQSYFCGPFADRY